MEWIEYVPGILVGLATTIPLAVQLVKYVQKAIRERNWPEVVKMVTGYMERAEAMFEKGADRREWVLAMVKASADNVKYNIDMEEIGKLIDSLCDMSKIVNGKAVTAK